MYDIRGHEPRVTGQVQGNGFQCSVHVRQFVHLVGIALQMARCGRSRRSARTPSPIPIPAGWWPSAWACAVLRVGAGPDNAALPLATAL